MATACTIEDMYKNFQILADAKEKAGENVDAFKLIMSGASGGSNEKRLASQFIARFHKHFPSLFDKCLDVMMDLCEDSDVAIRKQAIKDLPALCRDNPAQCQHIADVLTQLMQSDDANELSLVNMSLVTLLKTNAKGALAGIFSQILHGDEQIRERAITFLSTKIRVLLVEDMLPKDAEEELIAVCKKVLLDVTAVEFVTFMRILTSLPSMNTLVGRQQLVEIVADQADLSSAFNVKDPDSTDRLMQCIKQAMPLFSKNVHATRFVEYLCLQVLPVLADIGSDANSDIQLDLLKLLAEMVVHCGELSSVERCTANIYDCLLEYMPLPPADDAAVSDSSSTDTASPKLQFSYVECLMFAFHQVARRYPQFLTAEDNAATLKDFRMRLQYFARGVQAYIKQLRLALQDKTGDALKTEDNKIKTLALKTTSNINTLIKDLFYNPPAYKATVTLSWKTEATAQKPTTAMPTAQKRSTFAPVTFESSESSSKKIAKNDQKIYSPPSGKFSEKAGTFEGGSQGGGRWQYSRGQRGRGFRGYRRY